MDSEWLEPHTVWLADAHIDGTPAEQYPLRPLPGARDGAYDSDYMWEHRAVVPPPVPWDPAGAVPVVRVQAAAAEDTARGRARFSAFEPAWMDLGRSV